jgi:two-component system response regulator ResD
MLRRDPAAKPRSLAQRRHGRILVVDGDEGRRLALADALRGDGHDVEEASNALSAARLAIRSPPDLVIADVALADVSGITLCTALRRDAETIRVLVLVLSSVGSEAERVEAFEAGADDYMTRPFSTRELLLRARALLRRVPSPKKRGADPR